jgi:hypothetical protein
VIVAGGTYRELVTTTHHSEDIAGSGFRAAAALPAAHTTLITAVEPELAKLLAGAAQIFGFTVVDHGRDKPVGFDYFTPFVQPVLRGSGSRLNTPLVVESTDVLAFGMVEIGARTFEIETLVYDPQSVDDPGLAEIADLKRRKFALCANTSEIDAIGGGKSLAESAKLAGRRLRADVVVAKAGGRGCLVTDMASGQQHWVGAIPTSDVWKLGSGDVFSAGFAHAWISGADAVEAANVASHSAAWWCATRRNRVPDEILAGKEHPIPGASAQLNNAGAQPSVYLAGPFFTIAERWLVDACRDFLVQAGATVFSPVHEVGLGGPEVAKQDLDGLADSGVVFALLDGWDPGTLFETGWAHHAGLPTVAVAANLDALGTTMLQGTGAELHTDVTTALYRAIWRGLGAPNRSDAIA